MPLKVVEEITEEPRAPLRINIEPPPPEKPRKALDAQLLPVLQAIAAVLAIRVLLALAGCGGFILALIAALMPSWGSLTASAFYDVGALLPMILYAAFRRG